MSGINRAFIFTCPSTSPPPAIQALYWINRVLILKILLPPLIVVSKYLVLYDPSCRPPKSHHQTLLLEQACVSALGLRQPRRSQCLGAAPYPLQAI